MIQCELLFNKGKRIRPHTYQAISGFIELQKQNKVSLKYSFINTILLPENTFGCKINNKHIIFYDLEDGIENINLDFIKKVHSLNGVLFKRAYEEKKHKNDLSIRPYGFNYNKLSYSFCDKVIAFFADHGMISLLFSTQLLSNIKEWDLIDNTPCNYSNRILFCSRLWPQKEELNDTRIKTVKTLRHFFRNSIVAGFCDSPTSRRLCKDLILPHKITKRNNFIRLVQSTSICITTTGLYNSTGWKFGEYISCGKAIVSEPLLFSVPGHFQEGINYLSFNGSEQLIEKCVFLLDHPLERRIMEKNNIGYYFQNLRPDALIWNTLMQIT